MCFRFVPLSSQLLPEIPSASPLKPSWMAAQVMAEHSNLDQPRIQPNFLLVGLLLVYEQHHNGSVCIRQDPIFWRSGILGIFVPFDREIHEYTGVYLYGAQNVPNAEQVANTIRAFSEQRSKDYLPTAVKFFSFDPAFAHAGHLDMVRNLVLPDQNESSDLDSGLFFLSNMCLSHLAAFREHFVGYIELEGRKWPIFLDRGYLCLNLDSFDSLLTDFAFWVDAQYRIRLGPYTIDHKSRPVLRFTTMTITLPLCFEYSGTSLPDLPQVTSPTASSTNTSTNILGLPSHPWADSAGLPMVPTGNNTLQSLGRIPRNFPVMDRSPNIVLDPWLPRFVHDIISDAKKRAVEMVYSMSLASIIANSNNSMSGSQRKARKEKSLQMKQEK